jgi:hypothetical protein
VGHAIAKHRFFWEMLGSLPTGEMLVEARCSPRALPEIKTKYFRGWPTPRQAQFSPAFSAFQIQQGESDSAETIV